MVSSHYSAQWACVNLAIVHETVQPVIHKEVLAPEVVHTTIPIHEKHIAPSEHHGMSQLPMKTLDQMQSSGADLTAGSHQVHQYEGHPKPYNQAMQPHPADVDLHPGRHDGTHDPVKTGHFDHLKGSEAGTGAAATGAATGLGAREEAGYGSGAPLQQNTGDRYGASQGIGSSTGYGTGQGIGSSTGYGTGQGIGSSTGYSEGQGIGSTTGYGEGQGVGSTIGDRYGAGQGVGSTGTRDLTSGSGTLHEGTDVRHGGGALGGATAAAGAGAGAAGLASHHHHGEESGTLGHNETTTGSGFGSNTGNLGTTGRETGHGYNTTDDPSQRTSAGSMLTGAGDRHGLQDETTTDRSPATQQPSDTRNRDEPSNIEGEGAGKSIKPSGGDDIQHGSQGQDPSLVTDGKSKLTGTGVDGSHSAVFGLTPDGHRHKDTAHGSNTSQLPQDSDKNRDAGDRAGGHSDGRAGPESDEKRAGTEGVSEQLTDPNVASKGHSGQAEYGSGDGSKPGAGGATDKII